MASSKNPYEGEGAHDEDKDTSDAANGKDEWQETAERLEDCLQKGLNLLSNPHAKPDELLEAIDWFDQCSQILPLDDRLNGGDVYNLGGVDLYNVACSYSRLFEIFPSNREKVDGSLNEASSESSQETEYPESPSECLDMAAECLISAYHAGYTEFEHMQTDEDLQSLREQRSVEFELLIDIGTRNAQKLGNLSLFGHQNHPLIKAEAQEQQQLDEKSPFDKWVDQFPSSRNIPIQAQLDLACQLCDVDPSALHTAMVPTTDDEVVESQVVSWKGVHPRWFLDVFMKSTQVRRLLEYGCRMWFVRTTCVKVILRGSGVTSGCLINHLNIFEAEQNSNASSQSRAQGKATCFISFTGSYTLKEFASLLSDKDLENEYLWVDTLCVNQMLWTERKDDKMRQFKRQFMIRLQEQIASLGTFALLLNTWDDWMTALGQIWVLWELFSSTQSTKTTLKIIMEQTQIRDLLLSVAGVTNVEMRVLNALGKLDVRYAQASSPLDKELIFGIIGSEGLMQVNSDVASKLRSWLCMTARELFERERTKGRSVLSMANNLGLIYQRLGHFEESEALFRFVLREDGESKMHGPNLNLANLLQEMGNAEEAETGYRKLEAAQSILSVDSSVGLANLLLHHHKYDEAESVLRKSIRTHSRVLTEDDNKRFCVLNGLANILIRTNRLSQGCLLHSELLRIVESRYENDHPLAMQVVNNFAALLQKAGYLEQAEDTDRFVLRMRRFKFGNHHPETMQSMFNLAHTILLRGQLTEAKAIILEALEGQKERLGPEHPDTLRTEKLLIKVLSREGRKDDANALLAKHFQLFLKTRDAVSDS